MKGFDVRELVAIGCFSAAGGALEISIGTLLQIFPVVPFKGLLMTAALTALLIAVRMFTGRKRAPLVTGCIIAFLKLLSPGAASFFVSVILAIILESLVVSIILIPGCKTYLYPVLAGIGGAFTSLIHKFGIQILYYGKDITYVYIRIVKNITTILGIEPEAALWLVIPVLIVHVLVGSIGGICGLHLGRTLLISLGKNVNEPAKH